MKEQEVERRSIQLLTNKEYASLYGVHVNTVLRWVEKGKIPMYYCGHSTKGEYRRYYLNPLDVPYDYQARLPETDSQAFYTKDGRPKEDR